MTNYLYDRQNVILETDAEGNTRASYVKGINYISKTDGTGKDSYYLFNVHGDVVQTVDAAGSTQNQYEYDIWGNPVLTIEASENAIRYAGEFLDSETGLYYLRARFYDPYLGRFTTEDSYWGEDENPLSLNLYTYCVNDPVRYVDLSGHYYYVDENGKGHVSEITVGWNVGLNPDIIYDKVIFEGNHINVTTGGAQIGSTSGSKDIVDAYNKSPESSAFMYVPSTMKLDTVVTGSGSTSITNQGYIATIYTGKDSSLNLNNYGKVMKINVEEGTTANIFNYNQEKDPETNEYIKSIEVITGGLKSKINLFNYGGVGEVHTGDYSENLVYNENEEAYVKWLETGLENSTTFNGRSAYKISGQGTINYPANTTITFANNKTYADVVKVTRDSANSDNIVLIQKNGTKTIITKNVLEQGYRISTRLSNGAVSESIYDPQGKLLKKFEETNNPNDILFSNIDMLYSLASQYTNNKALANKLVLMYIRQFNKSYTTSDWDVVAGKVDNKFVNYVQNSNSDLAKYFSGNVYIVDPGSNEKIEITHFAATLNALLYDTTWSDAGIKLLAGENNIDNLAGWAGDLQTLVKDVLKDTNKSNDYKKLYSSAINLMGNSTSSFSMTDLLADVDAVNINKLLGSSSINSAIRNYYTYGSTDKRYTTFVQNIAGGTKKKELNSLAGKYTDDWFVWPAKKWPLLSGVDVSGNQSKAVRDLFTDFIWTKMQNEK